MSDGEVKSLAESEGEQRGKVKAEEWGNPCCRSRVETGKRQKHKNQRWFDQKSTDSLFKVTVTKQFWQCVRWENRNRTEITVLRISWKVSQENYCDEWFPGSFNQFKCFHATPTSVLSPPSTLLPFNATEILLKQWQNFPASLALISLVNWQCSTVLSKSWYLINQRNGKDIHGNNGRTSKTHCSGGKSEMASIRLALYKFGPYAYICLQFTMGHVGDTANRRKKINAKVYLLN